MEVVQTIQILRDIIKASLLSDSIKLSLTQKVDTIEYRWKDKNLYVGIVGEFSSGKSTLINALIGQDYFVTNCLQGTTTITTSIRYGNSINLELKYKNGEVKSYSKNKLALIEKYLPEIYSHLSLGDRIKIMAGDFFGMNKKDEFMLKIFDIVTTSNEISNEMDEIVVYYPSDFLKNGIVLIDTPGTDSLMPNHTEITKSTLKNKCNLALVIIPSNSPVSITLSDFISDNLEHCIDYCSFLLTKIELLRNDKEREELMKGVSIRLQYSLDIDNPHIIAAPTLLSLEERGIIEPTGKLTYLSKEQRTYLIDNFNRDMIQLFQNLSEKKQSAIYSTVSKLLKEFTEEVSNNLKNVVKEKEATLKEIQDNRTIPLGKFIKKINRKDLDTNQEIALDRIMNYFTKIRSNFEREINTIISNAETKDEIQDVMKLESVLEKAQANYKECYDYMNEQTNWIIQCSLNAMSEFEKDFQQTYKIEPIDFSSPVETNSITIKNYRNTFSKSSLSTFPLKRMFIKKEQIRSEMREAVHNYLETIFDKLYNQYKPKIMKIDDRIKRSIEKYILLYPKKFEKIINARIDDEYRTENLISSGIKMTSEQINRISSLK